MDTNSKTSMYNSSAYGQKQAAKQAVFNNSKYGQMQAKLAANSAESNTTKRITLPDGRVLVRPASGNRIDFKSLFGGFTDDDTDTSNAATLSLINSFKSTSSSLLSAYEKQAKQRLGLS